MSTHIEFHFSTLVLHYPKYSTLKLFFVLCRFIKIKNYVQEAETRLKQGTYPTVEMQQEWEHKQWQKEMLARARGNKSRFLRQVPRKTGTQIMASRFKPNTRQLEPPEQSTLGWRFASTEGNRAKYCAIRRPTR